MGTSDEIVEELREVFAVEAAEHVQVLNRGMLALEAGGAEASEETMGELFRAAHTLKGAARAVNLVEVEALAHELEDLFSAFVDEAAGLDPGLIQRAYQTVDAIAGMIEPTAPSSEDTQAGHDEPSAQSPRTSRPATGDVLEDTVRISTRKLDTLLAQVGEMTISRLAMEQRLADARALERFVLQREAEHRKGAHRDGAAPIVADDLAEQTRRGLANLRTSLDSDLRRLTQVMADLEQDVNRARLTPVASILHGFPRMVRDLARDTGKEIALVVGGDDTEIDRSLLEQIKDPLVHLVRNCVEHGIEPPVGRAEAGKQPVGTITIAIDLRGERLLVEISDDGRGVDVAAVRKRALDAGVISAESVRELTDEDALSLIFRPGLTTAGAVTELSGRGVGLDAVRDAVERLHGSIAVESTTDTGTLFRLTLPVNVSTVRSILLQAGRQTFALPLAVIERILRVDASDIARAQGRETVQVEGDTLLLVSLAGLLGVEPPEPSELPSKRPVVIVAAGERRIAILADHVVNTTEVVRKNLPEPLARVRHVAGAAILGSGEVVMILNANDLVSSADRREGSSIPSMTLAQERKACVLVVEDSITTRTLEKNILQAAGYTVMVAGDGLQAWTILQQSPCDLVVTDVEMPGLDGLALTAKIRADRKLGEVPVVLVTSRDSQDDRKRGLEAGADAYIVKGAFDQDRLLDTIRRLL